jgi:hypothetical protein
MIVGVAARGADAEGFRTKVDAVCFGWFAPFFIVGTGVAFDVAALVQSPAAMLLVFVFLLLFLVARGVPTLLYRRELAREDIAPFALFSSVRSRPWASSWWWPGPVSSPGRCAPKRRKPPSASRFFRYWYSRRLPGC